MKKILKSILVLLVIGLFFTTSAYAGWNPKGWFKGKKQGWEGEQVPPGLSKKEIKGQEKKTKKEAKKAGKAVNKEAKEELADKAKDAEEAAEGAKKAAEEVKAAL